MSTITQYASGAASFTRASYRLLPVRAERPSYSDPADGPPRTWAGVIDDLLALRGLEDDWDGQGAPAPEPAVVDTALAVATDFRSAGLEPAHRAVAGVNGTVVMEWFSASMYCEVEVIAPDRVEGRLVNRESGEVTEFLLPR